MVNFRRHLFYHVLFTVIACNFDFTGAFAQTQTQTVERKPRQPFISKALTTPFTTMKDDFEPAVIRSKENQARAMPSIKIVRTGIALKTILCAPLFFFLFSQRQVLSIFFSDVLLEGYKSSLVRHPLRTKVLTGSTLSLVGDRLAQIRESGKSYDVRRAVSFAAFDCCYRMFQHVAIPTIVRLGQGKTLAGIFSLVPFLNLGSNSMAFFTAMERTILYQFGVIPFFYYPVFFTFTGMIQGLSLEQTFMRAKKSFFKCWKKNLIFWIPTQLVMFGLVDEKWQIPFAYVMGITWSLILSATAGEAKKSL
jgi:hypothetical protein